VLAGGLARRLGGNDKARIRIGGATMLERVVACLVPQCSQVILNANGDPSRFAEVDLRVVTDGISGFPGPLAGILAGLDWTADHAPEIEWVVSAPTDCPFLPPDLVERLHLARIEADSRLACAVSAQRRHPVVGLWPVALRSDLRHALLNNGVRKVENWIARYSIAEATWPAVPVDPFFNVNTAEDAADADRIATQLR
jgi:molybdopterin-guanine dinucleotide biosynthesis protein A